MTGWFASTVVQTGCTIEIAQTPEYFHAHVSLDGNPEIAPGDRVTVHGDPVRIAFGQSFTERRTATLVKAGVMRRLWTRALGQLELTELYEVSFSPSHLPARRAS